MGTLSSLISVAALYPVSCELIYPVTAKTPPLYGVAWR